MCNFFRIFNKISYLAIHGYGSWILYRAGRYLRSLSPLGRKVSPRHESPMSNEDVYDFITKNNQQFRPQGSFALVVHLYYTEVWDEIATSDWGRKGVCDFYISLGPKVPPSFKDKLTPWLGRVRLYQLENRGRDIYPFLHIYPELLKQNYQWVCKLHSKRSPHMRDGDLWRQDLFTELLSSKMHPFFENKNQHIIPPRHTLLPAGVFWGTNKVRAEKLMKMMQLPFGDGHFLFIAGSMFWFRPEALQALLRLPSPATLFEDEATTIDGLTAHAMERLFYQLAQLNHD